jgi:alcohol dehydrogenase
LKPFDFHPRTAIVFAEGALERLGELALELGFHRTLLVADPGLVACGHVARAASILRNTRIEVIFFHEFSASPDSRMVEAGRRVAAAAGIDSIVALGGGSSLDCAKGINFVLTGGGTMRDYWGLGKARGPMLPSIGIPTTAGTGSEAQSYALISDPDTHVKMACGDPRVAFRVAILDPSLTITQPRSVTATAGYDALSHAVESFVTSRRTAISDVFAKEGWQLLEAHYERVMADSEDLVAESAMLLGAHYAGVAIEQSMLGATHACANPLTAHYGTTHGQAIAVMLPHVVRWNADWCDDRYAELLRTSRLDDDGRPSERLARRLEELARVGGLPATLDELGVPRADLPVLAADAAKQWTGTFNPRPFDANAALALYEAALNG